MIPVILYITTLSFLLLFSIQSLYLYFLYIKHNRVTKENVAQFPVAGLPYVTIQLPLFNEPFVVARAIESSCCLDYPQDKLHIQVLDDSTDETTDIARRLVSEYKSKGFNIELIHRDERPGYKAGALANGMQTAKGDFIVVFDADFITCKDFIQRVLPYFEDKDTGFVQASWSHLNENSSIITYLQNLRLKSHFHVEQFPRSAKGLYISFDGSCGAWRRECIADSGGWQSDTLAEDLDLSLRAQLKGWHGAFLNLPSASAELPETLNSFKNQQFRWTKGTTEVFGKLVKKIVRTNIPFLKKADVLMRLASNCAFPLIIFVSLLNMPVYETFKNSADFRELTSIMPVFLLALVSTFMTIVFISERNLKAVIKRTVLFPVYLAGVVGITVSNSFAFFEGLTGIKSPFGRTLKTAGRKVKSGKSTKGIIIGLIELLFAAYNGYWLYLLIQSGDWFSIPFQVLFFLGYLVFAYNSLCK